MKLSKQFIGDMEKTVTDETQIGGAAYLVDTIDTDERPDYDFYKLDEDDTKEINGTICYRMIATKPFYAATQKMIQPGDKGGYVSKDTILRSGERSNAWIEGRACAVSSYLDKTSSLEDDAVVKDTVLSYGTHVKDKSRIENADIAASEIEGHADIRHSTVAQSTLEGTTYVYNSHISHMKTNGTNMLNFVSDGGASSLTDTVITGTKDNAFSMPGQSCEIKNSILLHVENGSIKPDKNPKTVCNYIDDSVCANGFLNMYTKDRGAMIKNVTTINTDVSLEAGAMLENSLLKNCVIDMDKDSLSNKVVGKGIGVMNSTNEILDNVFRERKEDVVLLGLHPDAKTCDDIEDEERCEEVKKEIWKDRKEIERYVYDPGEEYILEKELIRHAPISTEDIEHTDSHGLEL